MAGTAKKAKIAPVIVEEPEPSEDITSLLEGADAAWEQYKQHGQGTRITSDEELDAFMDSL